MYTIAVSGKCNTWNDWRMQKYRPEQVTMDMIVEQNATAVVKNVSSQIENTNTSHITYMYLQGTNMK